MSTPEPFLGLSAELLDSVQAARDSLQADIVSLETARRIIGDFEGTKGELDREVSELEKQASFDDLNSVQILASRHVQQRLLARQLGEAHSNLAAAWERLRTQTESAGQLLSRVTGLQLRRLENEAITCFRQFCSRPADINFFLGECDVLRRWHSLGVQFRRAVPDKPGSIEQAAAERLRLLTALLNGKNPWS